MGLFGNKLPERYDLDSALSKPVQSGTDARGRGKLKNVEHDQYGNVYNHGGSLYPEYDTRNGGTGFVSKNRGDLSSAGNENQDGKGQKKILPSTTTTTTTSTTTTTTVPTTTRKTTLAPTSAALHIKTENSPAGNGGDSYQGWQRNNVDDQGNYRDEVETQRSRGRNRGRIRPGEHSDKLDHGRKTGSRFRTDQQQSRYRGQGHQNKQQSSPYRHKISTNHRQGVLGNQRQRPYKSRDPFYEDTNYDNKYPYNWGDYDYYYHDNQDYPNHQVHHGNGQMQYGTYRHRGIATCCGHA